MEWISVEERLPDQNVRFLANTNNGIEMMQWVQRIVDGEHKGWYALYCGCACCNGYCTDSFSEWMPLPPSPLSMKRVGKCESTPKTD